MRTVALMGLCLAAAGPLSPSVHAQGIEGWLKPWTKISSNQESFLAEIAEPTPRGVSSEDFIKDPEQSIRTIARATCGTNRTAEAQAKLEEQILSANADIVADAKRQGPWSDAVANAWKARPDVYSTGSTTRSTTIVSIPFCLKVERTITYKFTEGDTISQVINRYAAGDPTERYDQFYTANRVLIDAKLRNEASGCRSLPKGAAMVECVAPTVKVGETYRLNDVAQARYFRVKDTIDPNYAAYAVFADASVGEQLTTDTLYEMRLVDAIDNFKDSNGDCNASQGNGFPFNASRVWERLQIEIGKAKGAGRYTVGKIGIIDLGVAGTPQDRPSNPTFPDKVLLTTDKDGKYGWSDFDTSDVGPDDDAKERHHGVQVATLLLGGAPTLAKILAEAEPSPLKLRIYNASSVASPLLAPAPSVRPTKIRPSADVRGLARLGEPFDMEPPSAWLRPRVDVVNISLEALQVRSNRTDYTRHTEPLIVVAAGNGYWAQEGDQGPRNMNRPPYNYPAELGGPSSSTFMTVAAVGSSGRIAPFSNRGNSRVDIAAPGCFINSIDADGTQRAVSGTSFAAPQVSFAAGLIFALNNRSISKIAPIDVKLRLMASATFADTIVSGQSGYPDQDLVNLNAILDVERAISVRTDVLETQSGRTFGAIDPQRLKEICAVDRRGSESPRISGVKFAPTSDGQDPTWNFTYLSPVYSGYSIQRYERKSCTGALAPIRFIAEGGKEIDLSLEPKFDVLLHAW